ncbi:hypothetical protein HG531_002325 [Fusarium graminearum]|nr:hypothetical protein HG531_002325 [Fusarium graminearum]
MPKNEVAVDIFEYDDSESEIVAGLNALALTPSTSSELPSKRMSLMEQWNDYFKKGDLEDYQRLCVDLDLPGDLPSKTKCRQPNLSCVITNRQQVTLVSKGNRRNSSKRRLVCGPVTVYCASREMHQSQRILLVLTSESHQLTIRRKGDVCDGCDELLKDSRGCRSLLDGNFLRVEDEKLVAVVNVGDTAVGTDRNPAIVAQSSWALMTTKSQDNAAHTTLIVPYTHERAALHVILADLAVLSKNCHSVSSAPPSKVSNAVAT